MQQGYDKELELSFENAPREVLQCFSISNVQTREIEWIWKNRIPKDTLTIIEGDGGRGKSTIVADLCSRLSVGAKLPDDETVRKPMKILLLTKEDDPSIVLRPRLEAHGANLENIMFSNQDLLLNYDGLKKLEHAVRSQKFDIIVIDPIVSFIGTKIDMNKSSDVRSMLAPLMDICRDYSCTAIVVRHFNKMQSCSSSVKGAGSADFRNSARSVMQVLQSESEKSLFLAVEKSNYGAAAKAIPFKIEEQKIVWGTAVDLNAESIEADYFKSALDEAVFFLMEELEGSVPTKEIIRLARDAGISERTLRRASFKMKVRKRKKTNYWTWTLPPELEKVAKMSKDHKTETIGDS